MINMNMASGGYYYPPTTTPYYYSYADHPAARGGGGGGGSRTPVHLFLFLFVASLFLLAAATLYALVESAVESLLHQLRPLIILSPLLLIVAVQLWVASCSGGNRLGGGLAFILSQLTGDCQVSGAPYGRRWDSGAGDGSSPWGVALALVLVLLLVSCQSLFRHWW